MAYGWCQKFKCGGIESFDNIKAFVDLGGKFDAGCVTGAAGTPTGEDAGAVKHLVDWGFPLVHF